MLGQLEDIYVPTNERQLRRIQRKSDELDTAVRAWARTLIDVLPKNLPLDANEVYVLSLFLSQQRRLNLQMDREQGPPETLARGALRLLGFGAAPNLEEERAVHRIACARLESDIERACALQTNGRASPDGERAIDWRVAIRFMAQSLYHIAAELDLRKIENSAQRFQLAVVARDLASAVEDARSAMLAAAGDREAAPVR